MDNRARYAEILEQLYIARSQRALSDVEENEFACALEDVWNLLDEREQHEVEELTEQFKRTISAPPALGTDTLVDLKSHTPPRAA